MLDRKLPFLILIIVMSCHSSGKMPSPAALAAYDTSRADPKLLETHPESEKPVILKTHLRDTTYASGSFILFLRPDDDRYAELDKDPDGGAADGDSDFGVGISNTTDSMSKNERYKDVKTLNSTKRYIFIKDCKGGPLLIDRDSVSYGVILSAKGKEISTTYNSVHSGDYLGDVDTYFSLHR
jgi:hypothetical protein